MVLAFLIRDGIRFLKCFKRQDKNLILIIYFSSFIELEWTKGCLFESVITNFCLNSCGPNVAKIYIKKK